MRFLKVWATWFVFLELFFGVLFLVTGHNLHLPVMTVPVLLGTLLLAALDYAVTYDGDPDVFD